MVARASLSLWVFLLWVALVACNLVHELGTHEHALASLEAAPMVGETMGVVPSLVSNAEVAEDEISTLAADVREKLPVVKLVKAKKNTGSNPLWGKEAKALVQSLEQLHVKLTQRNLQLRREKYLPPATGEDVIAYGKVSGMQMSLDSKQHKNTPNSDACEMMCSADRKCKSFSYNTDMSICMLSNVALGYSPDSIFYAKKATTGAVNYHMFPGLFEAGADDKTAHRSTKDGCQIKCTQLGENCQGFSFREKTHSCSVTKDPIQYDKYWDYYEKPPRQFKRGPPEDRSNEEQLDLTKRKSKHFWAKFRSNMLKNDKRKLVKLKDKVDKVANHADTLEAKLRAADQSLAKSNLQVEFLTRNGQNQENGLRSASSQLLEAEGIHKEKEISIALLNQQIEKRKKDILADDPGYTESGQDMSEDNTIAMYEEKRIEARKKEGEAYAQVMTQQQEYKDLKHVLDDTDKQQIEALTQSKTLTEDTKGMKIELKMLAVKAIELQKVLDREESLAAPPAGEMDPPSLALSRTWDQKANEAEAKEKLFFMSPAQKRLLNKKMLDKAKTIESDADPESDAEL